MQCTSLGIECKHLSTIEEVEKIIRLFLFVLFCKYIYIYIYFMIHLDFRNKFAGKRRALICVIENIGKIAYHSFFTISNPHFFENYNDEYV